MNLSPEWTTMLQKHGYSAIHWASVGSPSASDTEVMNWAREHNYVLFTNDLDFGALLANARAGKPSVVQFRTQNLSPMALGNRVVAHLQKFEDALQKGAFIVFDENRSRIRLLPLE